MGDQVLAWTEADGTLDYYHVIATISHDDEVLTKLLIDGEWIVCGLQLNKRVGVRQRRSKSFID